MYAHKKFLVVRENVFPRQIEPLDCAANEEQLREVGESLVSLKVITDETYDVI